MHLEETSNRNSGFWDELCGSQAAKALGVTDSSQNSLKKFDDWYFDYYPYLYTYIPFAELKGKDILEVGLGYGTVSQRIAEAGANLQGLDIAAEPVSMVNHRLEQIRQPGKAIQGSILEPPFEATSFDVIIAIGCLHHTGDLKRAIDQCWHLLKPGGSLIFMVYYAYSYRRWKMAPELTHDYLAKENTGYHGVVGESSSLDRAAYDSDSKGDSAPHTDWISKRSLRQYCDKFSSFTANLENIDQGSPFEDYPRKKLLNTYWPSFIGLDLYATARKANE
ncbi:MAG: class I SAM-dependent methyltransferase [Verrucomicrobiota bacterium]